MKINTNEKCGYEFFLKEFCNRKLSITMDSIKKAMSAFEDSDFYELKKLKIYKAAEGVSYCQFLIDRTNPTSEEKRIVQKYGEWFLGEFPEELVKVEEFTI